MVSYSVVTQLVWYSHKRLKKEYTLFTKFISIPHMHGEEGRDLLLQLPIREV